MRMTKKSQSWSLDIVLAVVVFMVAFFIFYAYINPSKESNTGELSREAGVIIKQVASEDSLMKVIDNNEINDTKLGRLKNYNYIELKKIFRTEGDFCLYIEDEKGHLVLINNSYKGIGSPNIIISGTPCDQK